jgi:hypothetical protein
MSSVKVCSDSRVSLAKSYYGVEHQIMNKNGGPGASEDAAGDRCSLSLSNAAPCGATNLTARCPNEPLTPPPGQG